MGAESFKVVASSDDGAISINQLLVAGQHCITREENANSKYRSVINKTEGRLEDDQHKSFQSHVGGKKENRQVNQPRLATDIWPGAGSPDQPGSEGRWGDRGSTGWGVRPAPGSHPSSFHYGDPEQAP